MGHFKIKFQNFFLVGKIVMLVQKIIKCRIHACKSIDKSVNALLLLIILTLSFHCQQLLIAFVKKLRRLRSHILNQAFHG